MKNKKHNTPAKNFCNLGVKENVSTKTRNLDVIKHYNNLCMAIEAIKWMDNMEWEKIM